MARNVSTLLKLQVPIEVILAEKDVCLEEVLSLTPGAILYFEKPADQKLDIFVNNKKIGMGDTVRKGDKFGIQVTEIITVDETIKALSEKRKKSSA